MAKSGSMYSGGPLAPNRNAGGSGRAGNLGVTVKGMPGGGSTGTVKKTSGDTYGADIKKAASLGAQEAKTPFSS